MPAAILAAQATNQPADSSQRPTPLVLVTPAGFESWQAGLTVAQSTQTQQQQFLGKKGQLLCLTTVMATFDFVAAGWTGQESLAALGGLPMALPEGSYSIAQPLSDLQVLGWGLGAYQFTRYRKAPRAPAALVVDDSAQAARVLADTAATGLVRDLINTPAADMQPSDLQATMQTLATEHNAALECTVGDALLAAGYRTIHAVGRAAEDAPRLLDLTWGDASHPKITLVGKGVCFDSGGLNIKPAGGMRSMKKDMGGAAQVLGLAQMIMARQLPVRLRVLVPAVENAIAGNAYRPGDVIETYAGTTVEIDNTDAEGRLVLCDALALAAEETPEVIIDFATLTGAARVAVGTEIAAMFCNQDNLANAVFGAGQTQDDDVWRLPLHKGYEPLLRSAIADVVNSASGGFAGATTAALFLQRFVKDTPWLHFDVMAFNTRTRPGHPEGGEAMGVRAVADYLTQTYSNPN